MPDPMDTTQAEKPIEKDKVVNEIVDKALRKRRRRRKVAEACCDRLAALHRADDYEKLAELFGTLHDAQYGAEAGGFKPPCRTDADNGYGDTKVEKKAFTGLGALVGGVSSPKGSRLSGLGHGAIVGGGTGLGAGMGAGMGAGLGGLIGALLKYYNVPGAAAAMPVGALAGGGLGGYTGYRAGQTLSDEISDERGRPWNREPKDDDKEEKEASWADVSPFKS